MLWEGRLIPIFFGTMTFTHNYSIIFLSKKPDQLEFNKTVLLSFKGFFFIWGKKTLPQAIQQQSLLSPEDCIHEKLSQSLIRKFPILQQERMKTGLEGWNKMKKWGQGFKAHVTYTCEWG